MKGVRTNLVKHFRLCSNVSAKDRPTTFIEALDTCDSTFYANLTLIFDSEMSQAAEAKDKPIKPKQSKAMKDIKTSVKQERDVCGRGLRSILVSDTCIQITAWMLLTVGLCIIASTFYMGILHTNNYIDNNTNNNSNDNNNNLSYGHPVEVTTMSSESTVTVMLNKTVRYLRMSIPDVEDINKCQEYDCKVACIRANNLLDIVPVARAVTQYCPTIDVLLVKEQLFPNGLLHNYWINLNRSVYELELINSSITAISCGAFNSPPFTNTYQLTLKDLQLEKLGGGVLLGLQSLRFLLIDTPLKEINRAFLQPVQTTLLHLCINSGLVILPGQTIFGVSKLSKLEYADLSDNIIIGPLTRQMFRATPNLRYLHICNSHITAIDIDAFVDFTDVLQVLDLSGNLLTTLSGIVLQPLLLGSSQTLISLSYNRWICECELQGFADVYRIFRKQFIDTIYCHSPYRHLGELLEKLSFKAENCVAPTTATEYRMETTSETYNLTNGSTTKAGIANTTTTNKETITKRGVTPNPTDSTTVTTQATTAKAKATGTTNSTTVTTKATTAKAKATATKGIETTGITTIAITKTTITTTDIKTTDITPTVTTKTTIATITNAMTTQSSSKCNTTFTSTPKTTDTSNSTKVTTLKTTSENIINDDELASSNDSDSASASASDSDNSSIPRSSSEETDTITLRCLSPPLSSISTESPPQRNIRSIEISIQSPSSEISKEPESEPGTSDEDVVTSKPENTISQDDATTPSQNRTKNSRLPYSSYMAQYHFEMPTYTFQLTLLSNKSVKVLINNYSDHLPVNIIWFHRQSDMNDQRSSGVVTHDIDYHCESYQPPYIIVNDLTENCTYTFCILSSQYTISPFNCQPMYVPRNRYSADGIWIPVDEKQFTVGMLCMIFILSTIFGGIIAYMGIRQYPELLEGSNNVLVVKSSESESNYLKNMDSIRKLPLSRKSTRKLTPSHPETPPTMPAPPPFSISSYDFERLSSVKSSSTCFEKSFDPPSSAIINDQYELPKQFNHLIYGERCVSNPYAMSPYSPPPLPKRNPSITSTIIENRFTKTKEAKCN